ncbi:MAG: hypothetical protein IJX74_02770 [Clostridia bacterium]|nr:hypothetical protein [Clostridia bacterium]
MQKGRREMIKGAQKKMVVVRTRDSRLFEEAYFVMRRDTPQILCDDGDIVAEANRIIRQNTEHTRRKAIENACERSAKISRLISFGAGFLAGGGAIALLFLLL